MLTFKHDDDLKRWRVALPQPDPSPNEARRWIMLFNALSELHTGKSAVVTSWYRKDDTAHRHGRAVDFRRLSEANKHFPKYTKKNAEELEAEAVRIGIPVVVVKRGTPAEHWHCGEVATLSHEA